MPPSVFITGASGYVGRHVAAEFLRRGYDVAGLVRSDRAAEDLSALGASPVRGDLEAAETYAEAAAEADVIVHAGFSYTAEGEERADVDRASVAALLAAAADGRARALIYTASVFRYGPGADEQANELTAISRDPADWRHALSEQVRAAATAQLKTAVIRLGWVYGSDGGTLRQAIAALAGRTVPEAIAGNRVPVIDVFDLARLYADVAASEGGVFHGCGGRPVTVGELAAVASALEPGERGDEGAEAHFASIFSRDTPAVSLHQPADDHLVARLTAALKAAADQRPDAR